MEKNKKLHTSFEQAEATWSEALVLVCEKCCGKQNVDPKDFRKEVKSQLKEDGLGHRVRIVASSCLGVCPKDNITVAMASSSLPNTFVTVLIPRKPDAHELSQFIQSNLTKPEPSPAF